MFQVYSAGREGHLPELFSYVNKFTLTPLPGLIFTGSLTLMFILMKDVGALLNMYMVSASFFYGLSMLALIVLRVTRRNEERAFKVNTVVISHICILIGYPDLDNCSCVHLVILLVLHHSSSY